MQDRSSKKKHPRDTNLLAKAIVDTATGEELDAEEQSEDEGKNRWD